MALMEVIEAFYRLFAVVMLVSVGECRSECIHEIRALANLNAAHLLVVESPDPHFSMSMSSRLPRESTGDCRSSLRATISGYRLYQAAYVQYHRLLSSVRLINQMAPYLDFINSRYGFERVIVASPSTFLCNMNMLNIFI